jgi:hypothetical protein
MCSFRSPHNFSTSRRVFAFKKFMPLSLFFISFKLQCYYLTHTDVVDDGATSLKSAPFVVHNKMNICLHFMVIFQHNHILGQNALKVPMFACKEHKPHAYGGTEEKKM